MKKYFTKIIPLLVGMAFLSFPNFSYAQCGAGETFFTYCYTFGEVNTVAFEVCPTAGMIAEADITQGTFDPFFPNTLTVYQGASGSGTGGTIVFGPTGGTPMGPFNDVSGNTITSTIADECLIFVINTVPVPGFDCATGTFLAVEACGRSLPATSVALNLTLDEVCLNAGVQTGVGGGTPTGGTYSGLGVTDDNNGSTFSFDPAVAGVGLETITYTNGGSATDNINVLPNPSFTAPADICVNAAPVTLTGGSPSGGTYSGNGVSGNTFNPGLAGIGVHTLSYTTSCGTVMDDVEVLDCGCPGGTTTYFYCYDNFEADVVAFEICPSAGMAAQGTVVQGTIEAGFDNLTVYEGASGSGTSGTLIFGPQDGNLTGNVISGTGANNCLIFVINSDNVFSCADGDQTGLQVCGEDIAPGVVVNFVATVQNVCIDGGTVVIGGGTPTGGTYSGNGVIDNGNGTDFTFDPVAAGPGLETVTYTNGGSATDDINVVQIIAGMATPAEPFCPTDGPQFLSNFGTPSGNGGVYSGTGITDLGDGVNFLFNPMAAGAGTHVITYTFTDANGCTDSDNADFVVALPNVQFTAPADLCIDAGVQAGLGGGTPVGGVYSGDGVTDDGNGMTYSFDPAAAGVGVKTITYTYTSPSNGCTNSASDDVEVFALPTVTFTAPADLCLNSGVQAGLGGGSPTGGVYSGNGVTDDGNGMTYSFDPVAATTGVHTITYDFTDANGCSGSASDDVEVFEPPMVTFMASPTTFCENGGEATGLSGGTPTGGSYSGPGVTDDGNGMTYTFDPAAAGAGSHDITYTFTDANGCTGMAEDDVLVTAPPNVSFTAPADLCINAGVQAGLGGGTPTGGVYSGSGVTDDNNGMTYSFDPVEAGAGVHTITYDFTDANGCTGTATDDVEVFGLPGITCPGNITQDNDLGQCNADVAVPAPTVTGGCFGTTITNDYNGTADASDNYPVGTTSVTFTVTDGAGNTATCSMTVTVEDNEAPVAGCQDVTVMLDTNGEGSTTAAAVESGSTDNCGVTNIEGVSPNTFDCMDIGPNTVTLTINDGNGNTGTCTATATVEDNIPPTAVCLHPTFTFNGEEEIILTVDDVLDQINSSDNCDIFLLDSATPPSVTCDQIGSVVPVTVVIVDGSGNPSQCTSNVTVEGLPCGWTSDPDGINCPGGSSADYDSVEEAFMLTSEGCYDPAFYSPNDLHGFIRTDLCGDGEIIVEVTDVIGNGWAGITMRETLLPGSKMLQLMIDGTSLTMRELRQSTGGYAFAHQFQTAGRNWLRLTRNGNTFGAYHSSDGTNWSPVLVTQIQMSNCIYIGMVTANKAASGSVTGTFENVEVIGSPDPLSAPETADVAAWTYDYQPEVNIYPNPTKGEAFVDLSSYVGKEALIRLYNSAGQLLQQLELEEVQVPTQTLRLENYKDGLYLIQIEAEGYETVTKKLTLMR